jgi:predicted nucleic acid-binding protein
VAGTTVCFLDTNILLRVLTKDDGPKAAAAYALLQAVDSGDLRLVTTPAVIFEVAHTLRSFYRVPKEEIANLVIPILEMRGLQLTDRDLCRRALDLCVQTNVSLVDAFNAELMRREGIECIYSWDEDFDKFAWVNRIEPAE